MPKHHQNILTYVYIIRYIQRKNQKNFYPKIADIRDYLQENAGIRVSQRTVQRYIDTLRNEFLIPLEKKSYRGGYFIDEELLSEDTNSIIKNLQILGQVEYFQHIISHSAEYIRYFSFWQTQFKGFHWLDILLQAIHNRKVIQIKHKKFKDDKAKIRTIEPYLIKEYDGRWYIVAKDRKKKALRNFGIDRIESIEFTGEEFKQPDLEKIKQKYRDVIGLVVKEPEIIRLKFDKFQKNYFKSQPWHHSYQIIEETDDYMIVELYVGINHELEQKILSNHYTVEVLYPKKLAKSIKSLLKQALKNYK